MKTLRTSTEPIAEIPLLGVQSCFEVRRKAMHALKMLENTPLFFIPKAAFVSELCRWLVDNGKEPVMQVFLIEEPYALALRLTFSSSQPLPILPHFIEIFSGKSGCSITSDDKTLSLSFVVKEKLSFPRKKEQLYVIGDSATISGDPFYHSFLTYIENHGSYRTVWEFDL